MSDELALGQRTGPMISLQGGFTQAELELLATNKVNTSEIQEIFIKFPEVTLNEAIAMFKDFESGKASVSNISDVYAPEVKAAAAEEALKNESDKTVFEGGLAPGITESVPPPEPPVTTE